MYNVLPKDASCMHPWNAFVFLVVRRLLRPLPLPFLLVVLLLAPPAAAFALVLMRTHGASSVSRPVSGRSRTVLDE
jgi:hypothetical protein